MDRLHFLLGGPASPGSPWALSPAPLLPTTEECRDPGRSKHKEGHSHLKLMVLPQSAVSSLTMSVEPARAFRVFSRTFSFLDERWGWSLAVQVSARPHREPSDDDTRPARADSSWIAPRTWAHLCIPFTALLYPQEAEVIIYHKLLTQNASFFRDGPVLKPGKSSL